MFVVGFFCNSLRMFNFCPLMMNISRHTCTFMYLPLCVFSVTFRVEGVILISQSVEINLKVTEIIRPLYNTHAALGV